MFLTNLGSIFASLCRLLPHTHWVQSGENIVGTINV